MIICIARDFIIQNKINDYKKLIYQLIDETRKEQENISYDLYYDKDNNGEFILFEKWQNENALQEHFNSKHFTEIVPKIKELTIKPSEVNFYIKLY